MNLPLQQPLRHLGITGSALLVVGSLAHAQIGFQPAVTVPTGLRPDSVAIGDFDGDGDRDLAVTTDTPDKVEIFLNNGSGGFTAGQQIQLGSNAGAAGLCTLDANLDGNLDLAVTLHNQNSVRLLINNGGASFTLGSSATTGADPRHVEAGDVDGDGDMDLATSNRDSSTVSVVLNNGGTLGAANTFAAGDDVRELATGDFNGDGRADIAVASHDDRRVNVFTSTGGGAVSGPVSLSVGANLRPEGVTTADLDGDGDVDIAAATDDNDPSLATIFLNQGGGAFGGATTYFLGGISPASICAADFDLDGDLDLATANEDSNNVSTIANSGGGTFAGPAQFGTGVRPEHVRAGDLDGNGSADLATANRDSNSVSVLLNQMGGNGGPTTYCVSAPNSAGAGAVMSSTGSLSIAANTFTVVANGAVPNQPGIFFYGANQTQQPFGDGFRCISNPVFRLLPPAPASPTGTASRLVDFTSAPANSGAGQITAGSTWNFQYWYRDPAAGGSGFNLSNGLNVTFQP